MTRPAASKLFAVLLSLNAAAVILLVLVLLSRFEFVGSSANAQVSHSVSGDVIVAPGQLSGNAWGCYVLDTKAQSLLIYQYNPAEKTLRLQAARGIEQDLQLRSFNTLPLPSEIAELLQKERAIQSRSPATAPSTGDSGH